MQIAEVSLQQYQKELLLKTKLKADLTTKNDNQKFLPNDFVLTKLSVRGCKKLSKNRDVK